MRTLAIRTILVILVILGVAEISFVRIAHGESSLPLSVLTRNEVRPAYHSPDLSDTGAVLSGHTISYYLALRRIPKICKDLYRQRCLRPPRDIDATSLLDSIFTRDKETAPFYFLTLTRSMRDADGAYSEALGMMAKDYAEKCPVEFVNYFITEPLLTFAELRDWARAVESEIAISDGGAERKAIAELRRTMFSRCKNCSRTQQEKIELFINEVRKAVPTDGR